MNWWDAVIAIIGGVVLIYAVLLDLVPDFVPVIGYADDVIIVALVLRSVIRKAGHAGKRKHPWR